MDWHKTRLSFDLSVPRDDYPRLAWGFESRALKMFSIRAGYRYRWYGNPLGAFSGVRTGGGFHIGRFSLDYAFAPFGDLGKTHRISVSWRFKQRALRKRPAAARHMGAQAPPEL